VQSKALPAAGTFPFSRPSDDDLDYTLALRKLFARISRAQYPVPQHVSRCISPPPPSPLFPSGVVPLPPWAHPTALLRS